MTENLSMEQATNRGRSEALRIAIVTETFLPRIDGTVTRLCHTVRHLRKLGHAVLVIAPKGGITEFEGVPVHGVPGFPFPLYPELKLAPPQPSIGKALARFKPDLIHASQPAFLGASTFYYSSSHKVPLVISFHSQLAKWLHYYGLGRLEPLLWWGIRSAYNRSDLVLATSSMMRDLLKEEGLRRVELWQRGVDTDFFDPRHASREMRARLTQGNPDDHLLLYVGRLSAEKDIESCRTVLEAMPGVRLALVGDGPHRRTLEQHFAGTRTFFAGYLHGADLAAAFASADVFLMPSQTETLGLVVMEAMASGCAVVAAGEGGIPDIVRDGATGHLFDPHKPASAVEAVRTILTDPAHREALRRQAREDAEQWGWAAATRQLEGFYREVIRREGELRQKIKHSHASGTPPEKICDALEISRATFNRLVDATASGSVRT
jgi:glycosyltransferase involved in cell wall biosynthesis